MTAGPAWGIALETRRGAVVEELLQSEGTVFPVQPKAAASYRERKAPSGVKDDQLDAWTRAWNPHPGQRTGGSAPALPRQFSGAPKGTRDLRRGGSGTGLRTGTGGINILALTVHE
jgi:hypothetical protein